MDEIRCPMCSKPNPADEEICGFCEARLRPLQVQTPSEELPAKPSETFFSQESDGRSEWLESPGDDAERAEITYNLLFSITFSYQNLTTWFLI